MQQHLNEIWKKSWLKLFSLIAGAPVIQPLLTIISADFVIFRNWLIVVLRGPGKTDSRKSLKLKIWCQTPFQKPVILAEIWKIVSWSEDFSIQSAPRPEPERSYILLDNSPPPPPPPSLPFHK